MRPIACARRYNEKTQLPIDQTVPERMTHKPTVHKHSAHPGASPVYMWTHIPSQWPGGEWAGGNLQSKKAVHRAAS